MKQKTTSWIIALFLIAMPMVNADWFNSPYEIHRWTMNNTINDAIGSANFDVGSYEAMYPPGAVYDFNSSGNYREITSFSEPVNGTINLFINMSTNIGATNDIFNHGTGTTCSNRAYINGTGYIIYYHSDGTVTQVSSKTPIGLKNVTMLTFTWGSPGNFTIYINGIYSNSITYSHWSAQSNFIMKNAAGIGGFTACSANTGFDGQFDEVRYFNQALSQVNITRIYNSYFINPPILNITIPINNQTTLGKTILFNYSCISIKNSSFNTTISINDTIIYTNTSYQNNTIILQNFTRPYENNNTIITCTDGMGTTSQTITYTTISNTYNLTYNPTSTEQNNENIAINFTIDTLNIQDLNATLNYNGTNYQVNGIHSGNNIYFNTTVTVPQVPINNSAIPFYWNYTIYFNDGTNTTTNTSTQNQTINWKNYNPYLNVKVYDQLAKTYVNTFTINATNGTESYIITTTNGTATITTTVNAYQPKNFTIKAYAMAPNNITANYLIIYNTTDTLILYPTLTFNIKLLDEQTQNSFNTSKPSSIQIQYFCTNQTLTQTVTQANFTYNITCDLNKLTTIVTYSTASASYYRTLPFDLITNYSMVKIWLIDAINTPYVVNTFQAYDLLGAYHMPRILLTRVIGTIEEPITGDFVDATNSITAYLLQNQNYQIKITSANQPDRIMGAYTATSSGGQILRLTDFQLTGTPTGIDATTYTSTALTNISGLVRVSTVINSTTSTGSQYQLTDCNGNTLMQSTSTNQNAAYTYTTPTNYTCSVTYCANLTINTPSGNYTTSYLLKGCTYVTNPATFANPLTIVAGIALVIILIALSLTVNTQAIGGLFLLGAIGLVTVIGWTIGLGLWGWSLFGIIAILLTWNAFK